MHKDRTFVGLESGDWQASLSLLIKSLIFVQQLVKQASELEQIEYVATHL